MKHSSGPWEVIFFDRNTVGVKIPVCDGYGEEQQIADAYLKAAAPDMYHAIIDILSTNTPDGARLARERARQAVLKAKPSIETVEVTRTNAENMRLDDVVPDSLGDPRD